MNRLNYYIDGTPSESKPLNFESFKISIDWTQPRGIEIDADSLVWRGEDAEKIIAMRGDQYGSFVGRPLQIDVSDEDGVFPLPLMMIDLRSKFKQTGCNEVEHGIKFVNQKDWLKSKAAPLQIARLEDEGAFQNSDYVQVPYNINYIPDAVQTVLLALTTLQLSIQTAKATRDTAESIQDISLAAPIPNLLAMAAVKALLRLAENALIVIALVKTVKSLGEQLYSRTRYHSSLKISSIFEVACNDLGLTFESTIFDSGKYKDAVIMPSKTERGKFNINLKNGGAPRRSDEGLYFFGEFIETMMRVFNADYKISNGVFRFERWDYWQNTSTYILPNNYSSQSKMLDEFSDNADSFKGGYSIAFALDQTDRNTLDNFEGTVYDVITENASGIGDEYDNDGGAEVIDLPLSLGTNKGGLTNFEELLSDIFSIGDALASLQGINSGFAQTIQNRVGNLQLSDHFTGVAKMLIMDNGLLALNQRSLISGEALWDDFHFINSFFPINNKHNQWENFTMPVKMCRKDFEELIENNFGKTEDGEDVEITKVEWTIEEDAADIDYRINRIYTGNLKQRYITGKNTNLAQDFNA